MEKKQSNSWIGTVIVLAVIVASVWVYYNYFRSQPNEYVTFYNTVKGLQASSPVTIRGVRVGKIKDITIMPDGLVKVHILLHEGITIPDSSKALLTSGGLIADKSITIIEGKTKSYMQPGDTLLSDADNSMAASMQVTPFMETAKYLLYSADTTLRGINKIIQHGLLYSFIKPLTSFEISIKKYETASADYNKQAESIAETVRSANNSSADMTRNSQSWKQNLQGIDNQTKSLADKDMKASMTSISNNIKSLRSSVSDIAHPDSSIGRMATDKTTYRNASAQLDTANNSMQALKDNPPVFSIFGKSKKKK